MERRPEDPEGSWRELVRHSRSCRDPLGMRTIDEGATVRDFIAEPPFADVADDHAVRFIINGRTGVVCVLIIRRDGRGDKLGKFQLGALSTGGINNPLPIGGGDISAITPLADFDAGFAYVGSQRFSVMVPDGINGGKVRHAPSIRYVSPKSIPIVSFQAVSAWA